MAARKRPAAKGRGGRFVKPWVWSDHRGERPIFYIDPLTRWEDREAQPSGLRGWLGRQLCRFMGVGMDGEEQEESWLAVAAGLALLVLICCGIIFYAGVIG